MPTVVETRKDLSEDRQVPGPPAQKPKVVRILARLTGGPARQACLLHERLSSSFETRLVTGALLPGDHYMDYLLSSNHNVFRLDEMLREISPWSDLRAFWKLFWLLRKERPQIVHTHTAKAGALGRLAAWLAGVPVIGTNLGAVGERIRREGGGWTFDVRDVEKLYRGILAIADNPAEYRRGIAAAQAATVRSIYDMQADYFALYRRVGRNRSAFRSPTQSLRLPV